VTEDVLEPPTERQMTEEERWLADTIYNGIQHAASHTARHEQATEFRVGVSNLGWCSEYVRRMLAGVPETDRTDYLVPWIGTVLGDGMEGVIAALWPDALIQTEVTCTLPGENGKTYGVFGHPDAILPSKGILIDNKTTMGLSKVRRVGPSQQQQFQRHCYAKGAWEAGYFGGLPLEQVRVANVWLDRSGDDKACHVHMEPYDQKVVDAAAMWLDEVIYDYTHERVARKEPPREVCQRFCGHFSTCRGLDTDVEGILTDPDVLAAVDMMQEARDLEAQARRLKAQAKSGLRGVSGSTGKFSVRWIHVAGGEVSYVREPTERLDVRKV
jgi:hypothetical protein